MSILYELEQLIRRHVTFESSGSFEAVRCAVCSDHSARGGFKFGSDGIGYNCFNCGVKSWADPDGKLQGFSKVFDAFGIDRAEVSRLITKSKLDVFGKKAPVAVIPATPSKPTWTPPSEVDPPKQWSRVADKASPWAEVAEAYLETRGLNIGSHEFWVSDEPRYQGRLIIPYFHGQRLIYWQGRAMDPSIKPRYLNAVTEKEKVFFNYDEVLRHGSDPLFLTEGAIDSLSIGGLGAALMSSSMSAWQAEELKKASKRGRKIIFVIDKNDKQQNGLKLGLEALKHGWHVTVMPNGVNDANDCLRKLGRLFLLNHLATSPVTGVEGKGLLMLKCK